MEFLLVQCYLYWLSEVAHYGDFTDYFSMEFWSKNGKYDEYMYHLLLCEVAWSEFPEYLGGLGFNCVCCFAGSYGSSSQIWFLAFPSFLELLLMINELLHPPEAHFCEVVLVGALSLCVLAVLCSVVLGNLGSVCKLLEPSTDFVLTEFIVLKSVPCRIGGPWLGERKDKGQLEVIQFGQVIDKCVWNLRIVGLRCCKRVSALILIIGMLGEGYAFGGAAADSTGQ
ncbi:unnamed protein product [Ilex paraguariensis]|uniref:Uncharacterized protein n=1 Tax=Ilex paraguariensis TaxID=185542 RepID=A0ABC8TY76_9AQUA